MPERFNQFSSLNHLKGLPNPDRGLAIREHAYDVAGLLVGEGDSAFAGVSDRVQAALTGVVSVSSGAFTYPVEGPDPETRRDIAVLDEAGLGPVVVDTFDSDTWVG